MRFQSFGEKIASIMQRPGEDPVAKDDVPWWMKYAGRGLGTVGSISKSALYIYMSETPYRERDRRFFYFS